MPTILNAPVATEPGAALRPDHVWQTALGELQLQLTGATYNTWLGRTNLVAFEDDVFVIGVHNAYAKDWLENRLVSMVKRTLAGICGRGVEVRFVVWNREVEGGAGKGVQSPGHPAGVLNAPTTQTDTGKGVQLNAPTVARRDVNATCDTHKSGWTPISHYENFFWGAYLGKYAFAVWRVMRGFDKRGKEAKLADPWTPPKKISAPKLAAMCGCTKQRLLGVTRKAEPGQAGAIERADGTHEIHTTGAFDILVSNEVARISKVGRLPRFRYQISVMWKLPLLSPDQAALIPAILQDDHDNFIESLGIDLRAWERGEVTDVT